MTTSLAEIRDFLASATGQRKVAPNTNAVEPEALRRAHTAGDRWAVLARSETAEKARLDDARATLLPASQAESLQTTYAKNIENFVGVVQLPIGLAGPLKVNGRTFYVPLATTEAALVASFARGAALLTAAGGVESMVVDEGVSRAPAFEFESLSAARDFLAWTVQEESNLINAAQSTTKSGRLRSIEYFQDGTRVHMKFAYRSGDASGQNMVTFGAKAAFDYINKNSPVPIVNAYFEGGFSSDKKASSHIAQTVRGRKVIARCVIPAELVKKHLHIDPRELARQRFRQNGIHSIMGTIGTTLHITNGITALYIACGQDPACAAETHCCLTRFELTDSGDLHAQVTMPGVLVGTVGGGTALPHQRACLDLIGCLGTGKANQLAEVAAAMALGGELSLGAAMAANEFASAHHELSRVGTTAKVPIKSRL